MGRYDLIQTNLISHTIEINDWTAIFLFSLDGYDDEEVLRELLSCDPPDSIIDTVEGNLDANVIDTGFTYSNSYIRRSVVYVSPSSSGKEFLSTFVHELAHLTCDICLADGISLRGEKIAYLMGEIALRLSDIVCHLSCDICREH